MNRARLFGVCASAVSFQRLLSLLLLLLLLSSPSSSSSSSSYYYYPFLPLLLLLLLHPLPHPLLLCLLPEGNVPVALLEVVEGEDPLAEELVAVVVHPDPQDSQLGEDHLWSERRNFKSPTDRSFKTSFLVQLMTGQGSVVRLSVVVVLQNPSVTDGDRSSLKILPQVVCCQQSWARFIFLGFFIECTYFLYSLIPVTYFCTSHTQKPYTQLN